MTGAPRVPGALNVTGLIGNEIVPLASRGPREGQTTTGEIAALASALRPQFFGAVGDGVTNDTLALQAFLTALRDGGEGYWEGTYLVDEGVLTLEPSGLIPPVGNDTGWRMYAAPHIRGNVVFIGSGAGTGPFLKIKNPTQLSGNGQWYANGSLDAIVFRSAPSKLLTRHGLFTQGLFGWTFGTIVGYRLGGSVVYPSREAVGPNVDAYSSLYNYFAGVRGEHCNGIAYDVDLHDAGNTFAWLGAGGLPASGDVTDNGALACGGQTNVVNAISCGMIYGWAIAFGQTVHGNFQTCVNVELGAPEKGIWVKNLQVFDITGRIEINDPALNGVPGILPGTTTWPTTMIKIGGGDGGVKSGRMNIIIRIDEGCTLETLHTFIDCSNDPNILNVVINFEVQDNAESGIIVNNRLAVPVARIIENVHPVAAITIRMNGISLLTQNMTTAVMVRLVSGTGTLASSGFGTSASKLGGTWGAQNLVDFEGIMDATNHWLNIRSTGRYDIHCHLTLPVGAGAGEIAVGSLVQYAIMMDDGAGWTDAAYEGAALVADANGVHTIEMNVLGQFIPANYRVWISLVAQGQNGPCVLTHQISLDGANVFALHLVSPD